MVANMTGWRKRQINELINMKTFEEYIQYHLDDMWRDEDNLVIGDNISDIPEIKIIFDGYGDLEKTDENGDYIDTEEGGNKTMESYAIFIHKDSGQFDFEFPEHDMTPWALIHRPKEEVCIYVWYDVEANYWEILPLDERLDGCSMTEEQVMDILDILHNRYYDYGSGSND